jgi:hypothetical protein
MAKLLQGGAQVLAIGGGNFLLAHLQTAAYQRFREGKGFFITFLGGTDNAGEPMPTNSLWCPPEVSLHFFFDEYEQPVEIQQDVVDTLLRAMNDPIGVIIVGTKNFIWPFTPISTDRTEPSK